MEYDNFFDFNADEYDEYESYRREGYDEESAAELAWFHAGFAAAGEIDE